MGLVSEWHNIAREPTEVEKHRVTTPFFLVSCHLLVIMTVVVGLAGAEGGGEVRENSNSKTLFSKRQTDRQADRQTEAKNRDRDTERQRDTERHRERNRDRQTDKQTVGDIEIEKNTQREGETEKNRQADRDREK